MTKVSLVTISTIIAGSAIGYFVSVAGRYPMPVLFWITLNGAFCGYLVGMTLQWRKYGACLWGLVTLTVVFLLDWIAGSTISLTNKLPAMGIGVYIGWNFWRFRKPIFVCGIFGGIVGFLLGLNSAQQFGTAHLEPGFLNAVLFSIQLSIMGMMIGSAYMKFWGWRFLANNQEAE